MGGLGLSYVLNLGSYAVWGEMERGGGGGMANGVS